MAATPCNVPTHPPSLLWHYTTQEAALKILESGKLWASHIRYLNDASEFDYFIKEARALLEKQIADDDMVPFSLAEFTSQYVNELPPQDVLVACFSKDRDDLSQWRAYGGRSGVSLGFDFDALEQQGNLHGFKLQKCTYWGQGDEDIQGLLRVSIRDLCAFDDPVQSSEFVVNYVEAQRFIDLIWELAPITKHKAFSSENEWRLVWGQPSVEKNTVPVLKVRRGTLPIPYWEMPLVSHAVNAQPVCRALREVVVGPSPHSEFAELAVEAFRLGLLGHGYSLASNIVTEGKPGVVVSKSGIPYRNW